MKVASWFPKVFEERRACVSAEVVVLMVRSLLFG